MAAFKIEIAGFKIRTATQRRFVAVDYRAAEDTFYVVHADRGREVCRTKDSAEATRVRAKFEDGTITTYGAFATVVKRSDSFATAAKAGRAVFDTVTGERVK